MSIYRHSSYAKCPDIAVCSGIKGIALFKLNMFPINPPDYLLKPSEAIFHGFWWRVEEGELHFVLIKCVFSTLTQQSSGTV